MNRRQAITPRIAAAGAVIVLLAVLAVLVRATRSDQAGGPEVPVDTRPPSPEEAERLAREAATAFLDRYVLPDGRVARHDQGGDTVSEGQAYALLMAVAVDDEGRFGLVWKWSRENLRRGDHLLASRWAQGQVADPNPASDADLDTARALALAADRFGIPGYRDDARRIAASLVEQETVTAGGQPVLVAGPWARQPPSTLNPSYLSPRAFGVLERALGDPVWAALRRTAYRVIDDLTAEPPHLPPDWAALEGSGAVSPAPAPGQGDAPRYGFDALRVPVQMGADCRAEGRRLAARLWPFLRDAAGRGLVAGYSLGGEEMTDFGHPAALVGAAGAAQAAGQPDDAAVLLARAEQLLGQQPSYYGAAWTALGRILLTTGLLDEC